MTVLKSVSAPAISEDGVKRLTAFTRPIRLKSDSTLFDAGYEQAKADFLLRLGAEVRIPTVNEQPMQLSPSDYEQAQKHMAEAARQTAMQQRRVSGWFPW